MRQQSESSNDFNFYLALDVCSTGVDGIGYERARGDCA